MDLDTADGKGAGSRLERVLTRVKLGATADSCDDAEVQVCGPALQERCAQEISSAIGVFAKSYPTLCADVQDLLAVENLVGMLAQGNSRGCAALREVPSVDTVFALAVGCTVAEFCPIADALLSTLVRNHGEPPPFRTLALSATPRTVCSGTASCLPPQNSVRETMRRSAQNDPSTHPPAHPARTSAAAQSDLHTHTLTLTNGERALQVPTPSTWAPPPRPWPSSPVAARTEPLSTTRARSWPPGFCSILGLGQTTVAQKGTPR